MDNFNLKNFINENNLGAYSLLKENKYFTTDEDGDEILNLDLASEYLAQTHDEEDVDTFFSDDEVFEDLPYSSEEFPTEESVEGALKNAFELYSGGGDVFEKLDPVGKEDSDINNDGKVDKTDKYLANRRKAVSKATKNEAVGGEMVEILGAFFALVTAGKTALEAVKILGDQYGDISISSIKDALKKYKASNKQSKAPRSMNELSDSEKELKDFTDRALVGAGIGLTTSGVTTHEIVFDYNGTPETIAFRDSKEAAEQAKAKLEKTGMFSGKNLKIVPVGMNEDFDIGHEDDEPSMLKNKMYRASKLASMLFDKLDNYDDMRAEVDFPDWWQTKLSKAKDMLQSAYDYLDGEEGVAQADAMNEEIGMEYKYDDIVGPLMQNMVKMEKWVAQNASDDTEAVQLLQLASNAVENFDNYMAYGTEMNEELSMKDITSGQRSYQQMKPYFIAKVIGLKPETEQKASELVLKKSKAFPGMTQIIKTAKTPEEVENVVFFDGYPDEEQTIRFSGLEYELYQVTPNPKIDRLKEEASGLEFKVGDKVTYLGHPGTITNAGTDIMDRPIYSVSYNKGTGDTKVTNVYNKGGSIKKAMSEKKVEVDDETEFKLKLSHLLDKHAE